MNVIRIVDVEASALMTGYPIEIGIATLDLITYEISAESCLICPSEFWSNHGSWDPNAEVMHGISEEQLEAEGLDVSDAAEWFRVRASDDLPPLYSDAAAFDETWIRMLFEEAGTWFAFTLRSLPPVLSQLPEELRLNVTFAAKERGLRQHRAADDAILLAMAVRELHSFPEWRERLRGQIW